MDTQRQLASGFGQFCRRSSAVFKTSLNVARDASAGADAFEDFGLLIQGKARD
jgi:hypothetical protein